MNTFFKSLKSLRRPILSNSLNSYTYMIFLLCTSQLFSRSEFYKNVKLKSDFFQDQFNQSNTQITTLKELIGPSACPSPDIIITTNTTWTNQTIYMCPGQKIIINPGKTLNLNNVSIKLEPSVSGLWSGIVVSYGSSIGVYNNSTITGASTAITGNQGFGQIEIFESNIIDNGTAIYSILGNSIGISKFEPIYLANSKFSKKSGSTGSLFHLTNLNIFAINCDMYNLGSSQTGTCISAMNSSLTMFYCSIEGFNKGIVKNVGGGFTSSSLFLDNCDILLATEGIICNDMNIFVQNCILSGIITKKTTSYGSWYSNNFTGPKVLVYDPSLSQVFSGNQFLIGYLELELNNSLTDATCNYWAHCERAVNVSSRFGGTNILKSDWGSPESPSMNYHKNSCQPFMISGTSNRLTNHHLVLYNHKFNYQGNIQGGDADDIPLDCPNQWRNDPLNGIMNHTSSNFYDDEANNNLWESHHQDYLNVLTALGGSDPSSNPTLRRQLENAKVGMGQCVVKAIATNNGNLSQERINSWISRADPLLEIRRIIMDKFFAQDFQSLINYLNSLSLNVEVSSDRYVFRDAMIWMQNAVSAQKDLYNLDENDLSILSTLATNSFGDYTEVLRGWLNMNYDMIFNQPLPPQPLQETITSESSIVSNEIKLNYLDQNECINILSNNVMNVSIEITGINGHKYLRKNIKLNGNDCLNANLRNGLYFVTIFSEQLNTPIKQTIFVK
jgi:hypothetical protein